MNNKLKITNKLNFDTPDSPDADQLFIKWVKSDLNAIKYINNFEISDQEIIENRKDFSIMIKNNSSKDVFFVIQVKRNEAGELIFYSSFAKNSITKEFINRENMMFSEISKPITNIVSSNITQIKRGNPVWDFLKSLKKDNNKLFENFYVYGDTDSVRQEFLGSYANLIAQKNIKVAYVDINKLDDYVKSTLSNENSNAIINNVIDQMSTVEYLIIDEIGLKTLSTWFLERVFFTIISNRQQNDKKIYFGSYFTVTLLHKYLFKDDMYIKMENGSNKQRKLKPIGSKIIKTIKSLVEPQYLWIDDKYLEDK
ncbi:hypothetical protein [Mycoplasma sp. OR1901]|uniref:hypothetical protein n=1 Tax=Mycoplasma sp. OR1901 TaxID=2742195 RepID=UPI001582330B|nr:hypothetical protein [Mycoplasma sp. OR1901]QKT05309.1 hypothetical protein HTZ87_01155 [Mycoplasma sp. OR1901]